MREETAYPYFGRVPQLRMHYGGSQTKRQAPDELHPVWPVVQRNEDARVVHELRQQGGLACGKVATTISMTSRTLLVAMKSRFQTARIGGPSFRAGSASKSNLHTRDLTLI